MSCRREHHALDLLGVPPSLAFELRSAAQDAGVKRIALVGGVVRDLLLHQLHGVPWSGVPDLDCGRGECSGLNGSADAALWFATGHGCSSLRAYGTVALRFDGIPIDLASARRETYPVPAQNPKVEPARWSRIFSGGISLSIPWPLISWLSSWLIPIRVVAG